MSTEIVRSRHAGGTISPTFAGDAAIMVHMPNQRAASKLVELRITVNAEHRRVITSRAAAAGLSLQAYLLDAFLGEPAAASPTAVPERLETSSGDASRMRARLSFDQHRQIKARAAEAGLSMQDYLVPLALGEHLPPPYWRHQPAQDGLSLTG
ncbi:MAG: hypothetical protein M3Y49_15580 [Actinomycetota bacterium]|nr:hypothetical protein [Actinomycetota bacterium]